MTGNDTSNEFIFFQLEWLFDQAKFFDVLLKLFAFLTCVFVLLFILIACCDFDKESKFELRRRNEQKAKRKFRKYLHEVQEGEYVNPRIARR